MVTLKKQEWRDHICKKLNELRERDILCDVVITSCEDANQCVENVKRTCHFNINNNKSDQSSDVKNDSGTNNHNTSHSRKVKAHSNVLAASSTILYSALQTSVPRDSMKFVHFHSISSILWEYMLEFLYLGTVCVSQSSLKDLKCAAQELDIKELISAILFSEQSNNNFQPFVEEKVPKLYSVDNLDTKYQNEQHVEYMSLKNNTSPTGDKKSINFKNTVKERRLKSSNIQQKNEMPTEDEQKIGTKKYSYGKTLKNNIKKETRKTNQQPEKCIATAKPYKINRRKAKHPSKAQHTLLEQIDHKMHDGKQFLDEVQDIYCGILKQDLDEESKCRKCGEPFKNDNLTTIHEITWSNENFDIEPECNYDNTFTNKSNQDGLHRERVSKLMSCNKCSKKFTRKHDLFIHSRVHSGEKPFACQYCPKRFSQKPNKIVHEKMHLNEKSYRCEICQKTFLRKWGLQEHKKIHSGEKPYLCQTCGKSFSKISNLQVHERIHSGIKPYQCAHCQITFSDPSTYKQHMLIHNQVKAYQCTSCGKQFARAKSLKEHERTHTGEKPYICEICDAAFANTSNLSRHKKFHLKKAKKDEKIKGNRKAQPFDSLVQPTLEKVPLDDSLLFKTPPIPMTDLSLTKIVDLQNKSNFIEMSLNSEKSNVTAIPPNQVNFVNILGNNGILPAPGNIINQSASISGILPNEINLQPITATSNIDRSIFLMQSDPLPVVENLDAMNNTSGNENQQYLPYQMNYSNSFNEAFVQTNTALQMTGSSR